MTYASGEAEREDGSIYGDEWLLPERLRLGCEHVLRSKARKVDDERSVLWEREKV